MTQGASVGRSTRQGVYPEGDPGASGDLSDESLCDSTPVVQSLLWRDRTGGRDCHSVKETENVCQLGHLVDEAFHLGRFLSLDTQSLVFCPL